jgi:hypothetical protein
VNAYPKIGRWRSGALIDLHQPNGELIGPILITGASSAVRRVVFYSWQSDLPNATNRGLIQSALEIAAEAITGDETIAVEPVIDRDTEGIAGSPDIASTIFAKLDTSDVVVADVSIISDTDSRRPAPNPNVLIEVGFSLKSLNFERVILVFNSAFGTIESLPFDLRMRRLVVYSAKPEESDRSTARADLARKLEKALRAALPLALRPESAPPASAAIEAIENQRPNRRIAVRAELADVLKAIDELEPKKMRDGGAPSELLLAIPQTQAPIAQFSKMAEVAAVMGDTSILEELYNWFGLILERYEVPRGFSGTSYEADFDFFRFVGHELFVSLFAFLLREQQWDLISKLLAEQIPVRYVRRENGPGNAEWSEVSRHVGILGGMSQQRQRLSLHGDILNERHSKGELAGVLPFDEFADADFFLYLRSLLPEEKYSGHFSWKPWSAVWLRGTPRFLLRAQSKAQADNVARALGVSSISDLKARLLERGARVGVLYQHGWWEYPVHKADIDKIGSRKS